MDDIAILGTGLIGGSIGLALRRLDPNAVVVGYDGDDGSAQGAVERGAVGETRPSLESAVEGASLVVIALPADLVPAALDTIAPTLARAAIVTDVASAKARVVAMGESLLGGRFVGGHPMAGSEQGGIAAADAGLFEGARWILTPTGITDHDAYSEVSRFVVRLGAGVVAVDPALHDSLLARISHVPQVVASAVVEAAAGGGDEKAHLALAANGFRDVTRIAASPPDLWVSILRSNPEAVVEGLSRVQEGLGGAMDMIRGGRWEELRGWLERARRDRTELFAKPGRAPEAVALALLIPDRPGVLAEVTTAAGRLGANIEDLRIVHSPEGGRGLLELSVAGSAAARELAGVLEGLGYHVLTGDLETDRQGDL